VALAMGYQSLSQSDSTRGLLLGILFMCKLAHLIILEGLMKKFIASVFAVFAFLSASVSETKADGTAVLGFLVCQKTGSGMTYLFFSSHPVTCTYEGVAGPQTVTGTSGIGFGVDLEFDQNAAMAYLVMGGSTTAKNNLEGLYVGVKASATVGVGLAVQGGLVGAGNNITLVPVGLGGQFAGFGAAGGISYVSVKGK
jgi:hypothetical protein